MNEVTDGYLTASIVNPSYKLAAYPKELITAGGKSRMPEYADRMTVRQLTDLVAFLQSRYTVRRGRQSTPTTDPRGNPGGALKSPRRLQ